MSTLQTSFTTYLGDIINGLWVTWTHNVATPGAKTLGIQLVANLYAAADNNFMFGQDFAKTTKDTAAAYTVAADWNYCKAGVDKTTCPDAGASWSTNKHIMKLVVIWANPDQACPNICFDGFAAQVQHTVTVGEYKDQATKTVTAPSVKVNWVQQKIEKADSNP